MRRPRHAAVATGWRVWSQAGYDRSCVCPELGIGLYQGLVGPAGVSGLIKGSQMRAGRATGRS
jgi:hypothetical protein